MHVLNRCDDSERLSVHTWLAEGRAEAEDGRETAAPAAAVPSREVAHPRNGCNRWSSDELMASDLRLGRARAGKCRRSSKFKPTLTCLHRTLLSTLVFISLSCHSTVHGFPEIARKPKKLQQGRTIWILSGPKK
jgi:hypothetical protein